MKVLVLLTTIIITVTNAKDVTDFSLESEESQEASNFFRITGGSRWKKIEIVKNNCEFH